MTNLKPSLELEQEIMEWIFSKQCPDHRAALDIWNNNPWVAVSMYEVHHYPENLQYSLAFPKGVEIPRWYLKKLQDEEMYALEGNPLYVAYPRAKEQTVELGDNSWEINRFGRVIYHETEEDDSDLR